MRLAVSLLAIFAVGLAVRLASADRATAEFFTLRGDKAMKDKAWVDAQTHYRRAIEEDKTYLPARAGLADALLGAGDSSAGLDELRRFVADVDALSVVPSAWAPIAARARKRLAELDAGGTKLKQIADKYAADMLALAARWDSTDSEVAALAYRDVLKVHPGDAKAQAGLQKSGRSDVVRRSQLFNGQDSKGWRWMDEHWTVVDGLLVVDVAASAMVSITEAEYSGDFDVRMEAKALESRGDTVLLNLIAGWKSDARSATFGYMDDRVAWEEHREGAKIDAVFGTPIAKLAKPFDPKTWNWYEMRFRGNQAFAVINGTVVATVPRDPDRDRGHIGVLVQSLKVAIRTLDFIQR